MKYVWEEQDILPGRRVLSHNKTEEYIISYNPSMDDFKYSLVSLKDGMIVSSNQKKSMLVKDFNEHSMLPCSIL